MKKGTYFALILLTTLNSQLAPAFAQGSLTPPGPPGPTMKTLQQVEPRTPISALPYTIAAAGAYYLTTNLTGGSGTNGITITANNVTLDLRGFVLDGAAGSSNGIFVTGLSDTHTNVSVFNGTVRGWGGSGIVANGLKGGAFSRLNLFENGRDGLDSGHAARISDCSAVGNGGDGFGGFDHIVGTDWECTFEGCLSSGNVGQGFSSWEKCLFVHCNATDNGLDGFVDFFDCTFQDCLASGNGGDGIDTPYAGCLVAHCVCGYNGFVGISAGDECTLRDSNAKANGISGINAGAACVIESCTAGINSGPGIVTGDDCSVLSCIVSQSPGTNGIVTGDNCRLERCVSSHNSGGAGISAGGGCTVADCTCNTNSTGISTGQHSRIRDCVACSNQRGISAVYGSVSGCTANNNTQNGIFVSNGCLVEHNACAFNGSGGTGDGGIRCTGAHNRVDSNHLIENNANGLYLDGSANTIVRNSAKGNTTAYSVGSGNDVGPLGSAATATSPWANLQ